MSKYEIILKNGRIWDGTRFLENATDVAIKGGVVAEIGKITEDAGLIFDVDGAIISPGFVDIHVHMKGVSCDTFGYSAEAGSFPFGVTTAVDACAGHRTGRQLLDNLTLKSYVFVQTEIKDGDAYFDETERLIDIYGDKVLGIKLFMDALPEGTCDIAPFRKMCDFAHQRNLKVMAHCTGTRVPMAEVFSMLSAGDICTHLYHGGDNTVLDDDFASMEKAREKGIVLDNGMAGGVNTDFQVAKTAITKGALPDTISTDITRVSAFIRGGNYGMTYIMTLMRHMGMMEEDILRSITSSAAKAIGKEDACGTLEVGKAADIAVVRYEKNPYCIQDKQGNILQGENGYRALLTMVDGQVMHRATY